MTSPVSATPAPTVKAAGANCWAYTFSYYWKDAAGSQCNGGGNGQFRHRAVTDCNDRTTHTYYGDWVDITHKSTAVCYAWQTRTWNGMETNGR